MEVNIKYPRGEYYGLPTCATRYKIESRCRRANSIDDLVEILAHAMGARYLIVPVMDQVWVHSVPRACGNGPAAQSHVLAVISMSRAPRAGDI